MSSVPLTTFLKFCLQADDGCSTCAYSLIKRYVTELPDERGPVLEALASMGQETGAADPEYVLERLTEIAQRP